ncbi:MAG: serine/threonine-protein kinase [Planctomycetota bacterium]
MSATQCPRCQAENESGQSFCHRCGYGLDRTGQLSAIGRPAPEWIGEIIRGKYKVLSVLGEGGFGTVFKVELMLLEDRRYFALKLLHPDLSRNEQFRRRFLREAAMAMELVHPNAIPVREFDQTDDEQLYFTMDYCSGEPLKNVLAREGFLTINRAIPLVSQILSVLEAAHEKGIIHRDLKPENVFVVRDGGADERALVGDFGLAKSIRGDHERQPSGSDLTKGGIVGTPKYMSPEQAKGEPLDGRSDLFSVGVMLFEMITGEMPPRLEAKARFAKNGGMESPALTRLRELIPPNLVIPRAVLEVAARALEPRPAARYQSAAEFREALDMLPTYTPTYIDAAPRRPKKRPRRWGRRVAVLLIVAAVAALFVPDVRENARTWMLAALGEGGDHNDRATNAKKNMGAGGSEVANAEPSDSDNPVTELDDRPKPSDTQPKTEPLAAGEDGNELGQPTNAAALGDQAQPENVSSDGAGSPTVAVVPATGPRAEETPNAPPPALQLADWIPYAVGDEIRYRTRVFSEDGAEIVRDDLSTCLMLRSEKERGILVRERSVGNGEGGRQLQWWWRITDKEFAKLRGEGEAAFSEVLLRWQGDAPQPTWEHNDFVYTVRPARESVRIAGMVFEDCIVVVAKKTNADGSKVEKRTYYRRNIGEVAFRVAIDGVTRLERFQVRQP